MKSSFTARKYNSACKRTTYLYHKAGAALGRRSGISGRAGEPELIVSLTTIPERIHQIHICIDSLMRQSLKPDMILLWLNETEVPDRPIVTPGTLPETLAKMQERGLTIGWCPNIGPYCKLIPTLKKYPKSRIVTADDDICYPGRWLEQLVGAQEREPQYLHCHRAHLMTYAGDGSLKPYREWDYLAKTCDEPSLDIFPTGVGGVLYAPGDLHPDVLKEELFLRLCPKADDIWLKAMSLLNGKKCRRIAGEKFKDYRCTMRTCRTNSLRAVNVRQGGNDEQILKVAEHYGVFGPKRS